MIEPRSQLIARHTRMMMRERGMTRREFATRVAEHYCTHTQLDERTLPLLTGGDWRKTEKHNDQIIRRFMEDEVRMPVDVEEAWLAAMPDPHRERLLRELDERTGGIWVRKPQAGERTAAVGPDIGRFVREAGEAIEALAPVLADGKINHHDDRRALLEARAQLRDVFAMCLTLEQQIHQALGEGSHGA